MLIVLSLFLGILFVVWMAGYDYYGWAKRQATKLSAWLKARR